MMKKIVFLFFVFIFVFVIYFFNRDRKIYYLNIGSDYGFYFMDYLDSKGVLEKYRCYSSDNIIKKISDNYDNIDHELIKADIISVYVNDDVDYDLLHSLIRKFSKEKVIFISKKSLNSRYFILDKGYEKNLNNKIIGSDIIKIYDKIYMR